MQYQIVLFFFLQILQLCLLACLFLSNNLMDGKPLNFRMKRSSENDHAAKTMDDRSNSQLNAFLVPNWLPFYKTFLDDMVDERMVSEFREPISEINSVEPQEMKSDDNLDLLAGTSELNTENSDSIEIDFTDAESTGTNMFQNAQNDEIELSENKLNTDMTSESDLLHEEDSNTGNVLETEQLLELGENKVNDDDLKQLVGLPWLMIRGLIESAESMGGLEIDISDDKNNEMTEVLSEGDILAKSQTSGDDTDLSVDWNGQNIVTFDDINEMLAEESTNNEGADGTLSRLEINDVSENGPSKEWVDSEGTDSTIETGGIEFSASDNSEVINNPVFDMSDDTTQLESESSDDLNSDTSLNDDSGVLEGNLEMPNMDDVTELQGSDGVTFTTGEEISMGDNMSLEPGIELSLDSSPLNDDSNFEAKRNSDDLNFDIAVPAGDNNFEVAHVNDENKGSIQINDIPPTEGLTNDVPSLLVSTDERFNDEPVT